MKEDSIVCDTDNSTAPAVSYVVVQLSCLHVMQSIPASESAKGPRSKNLPNAKRSGTRTLFPRT